MIYDKLENIGTYKGVSGNLDRAIAEIQKGTFAHWEKGRHEIEGNDVFCNIVHLETKDEPAWERHEAYLDIHIVFNGRETIRCAEWHDVSDWGDFDADGDCALAPYSAGGIDFGLAEGWFLIVFPQDAHMPGKKNQTDYSDKAIFKVRVK